MKKLLGIMVLGLLSSLILSSCRPKVDILDLSTVDQKILTEASKILLFYNYNDPKNLEIEKNVGVITGYSCDFSYKETNLEMKARALKQLKVKAVRQGANGIIGIAVEKWGWDINCPGRVSARGKAVVFK